MRETKGAEKGRWCSVWIFVAGETWPSAFPVSTARGCRSNRKNMSKRIKVWLTSEDCR